MALDFVGICIGNTRTRVGTFIEEKLQDSHVTPNSQFQALTTQITSSYQKLGSAQNPMILVASTCPPLANRLAEVLDKFEANVLRIPQDVHVPIGRQLDPESMVGDDRLLNAAAAYDTLRQACVVVDAGTAITVDFVDGDGTFHGGAIAPGATTMLWSLAQQAWQLPEVKLAVPVESIGRNTVEAMRSGVFHGLRGMVRELVEEYAQAAGSYPMVVATGGDAELLFHGYALIDRLVPDLVLLGIETTVRTVLRDNPAQLRGTAG